MSVVKRNPLFFPSLMNDLVGSNWLRDTDTWNTAVPAVNIKHTEHCFELALAVPSVKKDDFTIEVDHDVLTISSIAQSESEDTQAQYTRREFSFSAFKRSFTLPETVDGTKIDAKYEDGILKVTLPKKQEALPKPKRVISIE